MLVGTSFGGQWTHEKLEILRRYLDAYTTALKKWNFRLIYVDAFAGEGYWQPESGYDTEDYDQFREVIQGSAAIALEIQDKPFDQLIFVEKDAGRVDSLEQLTADYPRRDVQVLQSDANVELPKFCSEMGRFDRAVVFLDPFKTEVSWSTVKAVAATRKIDCWILFPVMAISRMMPTESKPTGVLAIQLDRIFGGRTWEQAYQPSIQQSLFQDEVRQERRGGSERIADIYRSQLESVFHSVAPTRRILRNSRNAPLFELFFAVSNPGAASVATPIADHILSNW